MLLFGAILVYASVDFPAWGDPNAPASLHVSPYYIEHSMEDTNVPNIVTSVLADYRGYDTMYETTVVLGAGLACFLLLRVFETPQPKERMYRHLSTGIIIRITDKSMKPEAPKVFERIDPLWTPHDLIIRTLSRFIIPFLQIYALYVVAHGHHSPGGGFQGGVILGASIILLAISYDLRTAIKRFREPLVSTLSPLGVFIYAGVGMLCLLLGRNFLDYGALAQVLGVDPVMARSHGILFVEIGVAIAVMATMILIYYHVSSAGRHRQGL